MPHEKTFCPYGTLMACEMIKALKTAGGIHLPDGDDDDIGPAIGEVRRATVIAIGPDVRRYKVGDIILMRRGQFLRHRGQKFAMIDEADTFGCENRDLEYVPEEDALGISKKKLKAMIFEEASQIVAGIISKANDIEQQQLADKRRGMG